MGELADARSATGRVNLWNTVPLVVEMQSEGGVAGAIHGALQTGSLLARPKRSPRQVSREIRPIDWQCAHCACNDANQFTRDGHYRRTLETGWGHLDSFQVPMLECQCCQHDVVAHFAILEKYRR